MIELEIDQETARLLNRHRRKGETDNDVIRRLVNERAAGVNTPTKLYTPAETCRMLDISRSTLFRRIQLYGDSGGREGLGPVYRDGRKLEIPESTLSRYMRVNTGY